MSLLPATDSLEALSFTSSELTSLDRRDFEAGVQQLLFQIPFGWLSGPSLPPDFSLENIVQYLPLIIYSS